MSATELYIRELVQKVPELRPAYDIHVRDNDGLLPHVFMGDVARFAIAKPSETPSEGLSMLLDHLDIGLLTGADEVKELIVVSFVENLIGERAALELLRPAMGERLREEIERICG